jgi:ABC-type sugar transport system, periplasmic component
MALYKKFLAFALAPALLTGLTACSPGAAPTAPMNASRLVALHFSWWGGDARSKATLDVIKQFEKINPNITIEWEYGSSDGYNDKLAAELVAGTAPDIVQVDPNYMPTYYKANKDYFIDFKKQKVDLSGFDATYLKSNGCYGGRQLGLPTGLSGAAIIENKGLASLTGVDLTKQYTWDGLLAMGKRVERYNAHDFLLAANLSYISDYLLRPYLLEQTGKLLMNDESNTPNVTQSELKEGFTLMSALYRNHVLPPESHMSPYENDNIPKDPNWIAGKYVAGLCVTSTADVLAAADPDADFIAARLPRLNGERNEG